MLTIWKLDNESWVLIEEVEESNLLSRLAELRADDNEYRTEIRVESTSSILEV